MYIWIVKAILQKIISVLPLSFRINFIFQKYVTKNVQLSDEFFETMLGHFLEFYSSSIKHGYNFENKSVLELGTGWHPLLPICFYLSGARNVITLDIRSLIELTDGKILLEKFIEYNESKGLKEFIPNLVPDRFEKLKLVENEWRYGEKYRKIRFEEILQRFNIEQYVCKIQDFNKSGFDIVYSVNVLEHVSTDEVDSIIAAFYQLSARRAVGYHAIGVYDHFVHIDKGISKFNYLKFSKVAWKLIDNNIQPQNRLRISYFESKFIEAGFEMIDKIYWNPEPKELDKIKVHKSFNGIKDIDVPYGTFVLFKD